MKKLKPYKKLLEVASYQCKDEEGSFRWLPRTPNSDDIGYYFLAAFDEENKDSLYVSRDSESLAIPLEAFENFIDEYFKKHF